MTGVRTIICQTFLFYILERLLVFLIIITHLQAHVFGILYE
jgi:hypothetical protein